MKATSMILAAAVPAGATAIVQRNTDAGAGAAVAVQVGSSGWEADVAEASTKMGSYALTISSKSTLSSAADGEVYTVHGTLTATLDRDPSTDASGSVTLNATF